MAKISSKTREVNLDLLRVFSMFLIVLLHSIDHSGVFENAVHSGWGINVYVSYVYALTRVCVNCFVLLSGYFLVRSKFRLQKLVALWLEVVFYSLVIRVIFMATGQIPFSITSLISCLVPVVTGRYWFITIYFALYLLSPFLNLAVKALSKTQLTVLNLLTFFIFSVWISLHPSIKGPNSGGGWGLAWFIVLYLAAAWFRLYYVPSKKGALSALAFFLLPLATTAFYLVAGTLGERMRGIWCQYDSVPVYLASLALFVGFLHLKIKQGWLSRLILWCSPLTFGVYLIHAHADVDPWLWGMLNLPAKMDGWYFPLIQIGSVVGIFVICLILDWLRKMTVGRIETCKFTRDLCDRVTEKCICIGEKILNRKNG